MKLKRVIPCLDVNQGRVVKGVRFANLVDAGCPEELAYRYEQQGADEIVLLDVSATPEGRGNQLETVRKVRSKLSIPLTVGGGVRSSKDVAALLEAGADKVGVNTAAVKNPDILTEMSNSFGRQCIVLALDAAATNTNSWEVVIYSGKEKTGIDAIAWAKKAEAAGVGEILLTSFDRDGTGIGYDLDLLKAITEQVSIPVIASGGAKEVVHLKEALESGADAVLAASIFHFNSYTVAKVKSELREFGIEVRL